MMAKGGMGMPYGMMPKAPGMYAGGGGGGGKGKSKGKGQGKDDGKQAKSEAEKKQKAKAKARAPSPAPADDENNLNRSQVLIEVRKNHGKCKVPLADVMPNVLEFAKDQHGSRYLQTLIDESAEADRSQIFEAILPHTASLANDTFGNFVVQKLFDICG